MKDNKIIQDAEIVSEKTVDRPQLIQPQALIEGTINLKNNMLEVKESAIKLKEFYANKVITEDEINPYKSEKSNINKIKEAVKRYRIDTIDDYKRMTGIDEFESLAKETERILDETYNLINDQLKGFNDKKEEDAKDILKKYFDEYKFSKNLGFTQYSDMNQKVNLSDLTSAGNISKKKYEEIEKFINSIVNDVESISSMDNAEEILVEYMKDRNLARSIKEVQDRSKEIERVAKSKDELLQVKENENNECVEIEALRAPIEQSSVKKLKRARFEIIYEDDQIAKDLINFMKERGINYAVIK